DGAGDLVGVGLAERAAEDAPVLGVDVDGTAADGGRAGHHAVTVGPALVETELVRAMVALRAELDERVIVEQTGQARAGAVAGLQGDRVEYGGLDVQGVAHEESSVGLDGRRVRRGAVRGGTGRSGAKVAESRRTGK